MYWLKEYYFACHTTVERKFLRLFVSQRSTSLKYLVSPFPFEEEAKQQCKSDKACGKVYQFTMTTGF